MKLTVFKSFKIDSRNYVSRKGWNLDSGPFSDMVYTADKRKAFVSNAVQFILQKKFDGLDIDWEYPGSRDGARPEDKQNFIALLTV